MVERVRTVFAMLFQFQFQFVLLSLFANIVESNESISILSDFFFSLLPCDNVIAQSTICPFDEFETQFIAFKNTFEHWSG